MVISQAFDKTFSFYFIFIVVAVVINEVEEVTSVVVEVAIREDLEEISGVGVETTDPSFQEDPLLKRRKL